MILRTDDIIDIDIGGDQLDPGPSVSQCVPVLTVARQWSCDPVSASNYNNKPLGTEIAQIWGTRVVRLQS